MRDPVAAARWLLVIGLPLAFWAVNGDVRGPAYLADEIGYLANAAFLAGHVLDGASSYHAGYSLLLAPLFRLPLDPSGIWTGVLLVNALLFGLAFHLADRLMHAWSPDAQPARRLLALLVAALYPAWITLAGYAFASAAFVAVYLAGLLAFIRIRADTPRGVLPFTLLAGFLYWIHPTGAAVAGASVIAVAAWSVRTGAYRMLAFHALGVAALVLAYRQGIHPWLVEAMTPAGQPPLLHYPDLSSMLAKTARPGYWSVLATRAGGQLSYLLVGSLGLAFFGLLHLAGRLRGFCPGGPVSRADAAAAYALLSVLGIILLGAMGFPNRVDHWIYGRYLDGVSLPLIAAGALALLGRGTRARLGPAALAAGLVIVSGLLISQLYAPNQPNNLVNTPAFWPQYLSARADVVAWMAAGAAAIVVVALGGGYLLLPAALASLAVSATHQLQWHQRLLAGHSRPTAIAEVVRANYPPGTCVGFEAGRRGELDLYRWERFGLYKYHLHDYRYRRMSADEWRTGCDGPLLTYEPGRFAGRPAETPLAREKPSGLTLVVKGDGGHVPPALRERGDLYLGDADGDACLLGDCFAMAAGDLARFSRVGVPRGRWLASAGRDGFLFHGPYRRLERGDYALTVRGRFTAADGAVIDVVGDKGATTYHRARLCPSGCPSGERTLVFRLDHAVQDIEIRLRVGRGDRLAVEGYELVVVTGDPAEPGADRPVGRPWPTR